MQPPSPTLPASPWPGSSTGITGGGKEPRSSAGAPLQLAVAEGVQLNVARDGLARADNPPVSVSELFPPGRSLQAERK